MNGLDLSGDLPIWSSTIYHSERGATNPWNRVFNSVSTGDEQVDRRAALEKAVTLFVDDGLSVITIYRIETAPLIKLEGGEENA